MQLIKLFIPFAFLFSQCNPANPVAPSTESHAIYVKVLGIAQDGGYPQAGCNKNCCAQYYKGNEQKHLICCIGLVDPSSHQSWMFDATPDFREQYKELTFNDSFPLKGIFLTHAHIGHYSGLMQLGREVMNTQNLPVYAMSRMVNFLQNNGPWSQLVSLQNISLLPLKNDSSIVLNNGIKVTPWLVPHRDEYSETVGFLIEGPSKKVLFIPDINKWQLWGRTIAAEIQKVDVAYIDATFFKDGEINRKMSEVPHPFIVETIQLLASLSQTQKSKVHFIHFNHTNPALQKNQTDTTYSAREWIQQQGFQIAEEGERVYL